MRGQFITIEGQDGAGKSTNLAVMQSFLEEQNVDFLVTREPGGTRFGETLREVLLSSSDDVICDMSELLIVFAARAQHIEQVIEPALKSGKWVLCDRFTDASYAYQGGGRGINNAHIAQLEQMVQSSLRPDLTLLLDLPVTVGESRAGQRSDPDRFEQQQQAFKQRVRDSYLNIAERDKERMLVINADQTMLDVESDIRQAMQLFWDTQNG